MRRFSTTLAAAALAATATLSPIAAQAQDAQPAQTTQTTQTKTDLGTYVELTKVLNGEIKTANCDTLSTTLKLTKMVDGETTRSTLVQNLNKVVGENSVLRLATAPTVNALGDRALECGIVKADPVTPLDQAMKLSSQLSSENNLPELRNLKALAK